MMVKFNKIDHGFCESYGQTLPYPEIVNSYSSLFISLIGIIGLVLNSERRRYQIPNIIYGYLFINGIGSFGYHYTQELGWAVRDELSMMICISLGAYYLYSSIIQHKRLPVYVGDKFTLNNHRTYKIILSLTLASNAVLTYSVSIFEEMRDYFPIIFAIPSCSLIPGIYYIYTRSYRKNRDGKFLLQIGLGFVISALAFWLFTELTCPYLVFVRYLHGHAFWHVGVSYGMFCIVQLINHWNLCMEERRPRKIKYMAGLCYF